MTTAATTTRTITDREFEQFREFFYKKTGIWFEDDRRYFVDKRLNARIEACGESTFRRWFAFMRFEASGKEFQALVNAMTVNETYFFREDYQYECLVKDVLPEVCKNKKPGDPIRIWSLPCSTGEEPYSLVIWLSEFWPDLAKYEVSIQASDIDSNVIERARQGLYTKRAIHKLSPEIVSKYFTKEGLNYRLHQDWRECVDFSLANITDANLMFGRPKVDVIFCRNVLIYFDNTSRKTAAGLLYNAMNPGGFILLGHSESMSRISSQYKVRRFSDAIVYQRPEKG